ncbi:XamI family restriction endonuclease [Rhodococcus hoagii]|nr:XamI family restriction endonuclease [Prescottella equi]NKR70017.1 XamI family restriction endonuclease [Prescottella equi]
MPFVINADKPSTWKSDVLASVELYNEWFLEAAPSAYRDTRQVVVNDVENLFVATNDMRNITPGVIRQCPEIVATLRMATAPPIARDRLTGLADLPYGLVKKLEEGKLPARMKSLDLVHHLKNICVVIDELLDTDLFDWLDADDAPDTRQRELAAVVVSDRRCGAVADPIVRNAQEARQLAVIEDWLTARGYVKRPHPGTLPLEAMPTGTFSFRQNVVVKSEDGTAKINMPIDAVIQPHTPSPSRFPLLVEAKSAGDFTNTNKRRKEEATKIRQLRSTYGPDIQLVLFLCGYFDAGYLGYEAAEGLDWVWEHRPDDFFHAGL